MARRLVMLAVIDARISPTLTAHGRESATCVKGLGRDEELVMEIRRMEGEDHQIIPLREGVHSLPSPLARGTVFVIKKLIGGSSATTVEVLCA